MYRSCPLVQNFAKQGLKIRIRKESGPRPSRYIHSKRKTIRKAITTNEIDDSNNDLIANASKNNLITQPRAVADSEDEDDEYELDEDEDEDDESHHHPFPLAPPLSVENSFKLANINHLLSNPSTKNTVNTHITTNNQNHNLSAFKRVNTGKSNSESFKVSISNFFFYRNRKFRINKT